ncbi:MAG TPA: ComEC/Rec2 family competence protein, partial [Bacteroidales bacterium]|nr:ComEC/Rec2 family competence protein [Bacteroidales bacterium]
MLNKEIPFLRIGLPLSLGIISGLWLRPEYLFFLVSVSIVVAGFCLSLFFNNRQSNVIYGITLNIALFCCGLFLYNHEKSGLSELKPEERTFLCVLSEYPGEKPNSYMLTVRLKQVVEGLTSRNLKGSMVIYLRKGGHYPGLLPGDHLLVTCTPQPINNRGNPDEFNYRFYMENQGIKYFAFAEESDIRPYSVTGRRNLMHLAQITRQGIIGLYRKLGIEGDELAVVAAITLGQKNMLDPDQKENFIKAGVVHIMAVSGLHAMILSLFVFNILFFLKRKYNTLRVIITIVILWGFAFITGLAPSVQRASLMFTFLQAGKLMHRHVNSINSVLASAFVLILIRPSVIFGAGFLLSYSAVIFIICFY